jgi:acetyl esterase/lipase
VIAPERLGYGRGPQRFGELWPPASPDPAPWPVVVLLHGGFWRAGPTLEAMRPLAIDLAGRDLAVWNLEYRRVGQRGGGWPGTLRDVAVGIDHLVALAGRFPLDLGQVTVIGHAAGGQLALWAAARSRLPPRAPGARPKVVPRQVVSLAGVCDLVAAARERIGDGAVPAFLRAGPEAEPERYRLASPLALLPTGVPAVLVHGDADARVPVTQSRAYAAAAAAAGDRVDLVELPGVDHLVPTDPGSPAWYEVLRRLT